jgi:hypothetical protein
MDASMGKLLAVGAQGPEGAEFVDGAAGDAGLPESADVSGVRGAEALRNEAFDRLP